MVGDVRGNGRYCGEVRQRWMPLCSARGRHEQQSMSEDNLVVFELASLASSLVSSILFVALDEAPARARYERRRRLRS